MTAVGRRMLIALFAGLTSLLVLASSAAADDSWVNSPAGPMAREIQPLYWFLFALAIIVLVIVDGGIIVAGLKFRERPGHKAAQFHGHNMLELTWTVIPTIMVLGFTVLGFQKLSFINDTRSDVGMVIKAEGVQWTWNYSYPEEPRFRLSDGTFLRGSEELHIPVGVKVRIELSSPDVIHDFFVQRIGGKKDAVPGRATELWIQADQPGTYKGQCAEFCGDGHADMLILLVAHDAADYEAWIKEAIRDAERLNAPEARRGKELFRSLACAGCHKITGLTGGRVGPELTHFRSKPDQKIAGTLAISEENLKRWLQNPPAVKPGTQMPNLNLDAATIDALTNFLLTLR